MAVERVPGSGVEILDLVGDESESLEVEREFESVLERGAGVAGDEVRYQVLFFAELPVEASVFFGEPVEALEGRFSHEFEDVVRDMFRGDFELAGDVVPHEVAEKALVFVEHEIVVANSRAYEDALDTGQAPKSLQEFPVFAVVDFEVWAGLWGEAAPVDAGSVFGHFGAGGTAEVGGGDDGFDAARGDHAALMKRKGAK
jgi:hypothetical protein